MKNEEKYKVLMIAPGKKTLGGITKVVSYYESSSFWNKNNIYWVETHMTGSSFQKAVCFLKAVLKFLQYAHNAKIAHIHYTGKVSANRKFIFYLLSKIYGLKIISHIHSPNLDISSISNYCFEKMITNSHEVIVLSNKWVENLKEFIDRDYIVVNNPSNGFIVNDSSKENIILFAGKLESRKGYMDLLKASLYIKDILSDYRIVLAGNGEVDIAEKFIRENNITNIDVKGWMDSKAMMSMFRKSDVFILPSYGEGFPIAIIDALSNKCAVITTPVGGIPDLLINNKNCLFVEPGNIQSIANALETIILDSELKNKLIENGFKLAQKEFDLNSITDKLSVIYQKTL